MVSQGNDWLALTKEPTLEPEIPICDPHHHLWEYRPEPAAYQRYLLPELADDINSGHNVRSTVFIEVRSNYRTDGPEEMRSVGEVEFVEALAETSATGRYGPSKAAAGIIGRADLKLGGAVKPVLEALQAASPNRFRGIRHSVGWDPHPEVEDREIERCLENEGYRAGARALSGMGLCLETSMYFPQLAELAEFAKALPDLPIVLNHLGGLMRTGPYSNIDDEVRATWRNGIDQVSVCPNIIMKLGGVGMPRMGFDWHTRTKPVASEELAESIAPFINYAIEKFGPNRCMFESNFPPDKVSYSYSVMYNAFKRLSRGYSAAERAAMFHDNAARVYGIDV